MYTNKEVEPQLAVSPRTAGTSHVNLIGVWQQDRWSNGGARGLVAAYSLNGGRSWHETALPLGTCASKRSAYVRVSDPWVSIGPDGTAYAAAVGVLPFGPIPNSPNVSILGNAALATTSRNEGKSWSHVAALSDGSSSVDRVTVTADPTRPGAAYLVWQSPGGTQFARTTNGGTVWSRPATIVPVQSGTSSAGGDEIVVDPRTRDLYDVFDLWHTLARPRSVCGAGRGRRQCHVFSTGAGMPAAGYDISFVRSRDGGRTWSAPRTIAQDLSVDAIAPGLAGMVRTGAHNPMAAIDPANGTISVVWQDSRFSIGRYDELAMARSRDHGLHWTIARRVNMPGRAGTMLPDIAASASGVVGVAYYQLRGSGGSSLPADYWFRSWSDRTGRFGKARHVAGPFDIKMAPESLGHFVGDYEGIAPLRRSFQVFFVMTNAGNKENPTDVFTTAVEP